MSAELRLADNLRLGHKRVARLMRLARLQGVHRRRWRHSKPAEATWPDHCTEQGWVYYAAVIDVYSRRCVGWSIADHLRTELVVDALDMARWRRKPVGTILHSDRGTQYTSWWFGTRLREAGLLGSMGKVACAYDALMESFWGSMQVELLDRRTWTTRDELANAIIEWIEAWHKPHRRHSALGYETPSATQPCTQPPRPRHDHHTPKPSGKPGTGHSPQTPGRPGHPAAEPSEPCCPN